MPGACSTLHAHAYLCCSSTVPANLYRAFHALPDLRNSAGELHWCRARRAVHATSVRPDHKAGVSRLRIRCLRARPSGTTGFPDYKAQRPHAGRPAGPDRAPARSGEGRRLAAADGRGGVEADDVIGTLTRQAVEAGWEVVRLPTGDKDLTQLESSRACAG